MATEHNQTTKSMNSLESNASNIIDKDTDRKSQDSQDIKSEISTTKCNDRKIELNKNSKWKMKPLKSIHNCPQLFSEVSRVQEEAFWEKMGGRIDIEKALNGDEKIKNIYF